MDIFTALPPAIVTDTWELGQVVRSTDVGKSFQSLGTRPVIVDEVDSSGFNQAPNADYIASDTLLFVHPEDLPTVATAALIADYLWHNVITDQYYEMKEVGVGKNQETGVIEHIEFLLHQTGVFDGECD